VWGAVEFSHPGSVSQWIRDSTLRYPLPSVRILSGNCALSVGLSAGLGYLRGLSHLSITADVQLHNRPDLLNSLGIRDISDSLGDEELLLAAYAKWGTSVPEYLLGDFAFAIWDEHLQRLFCCRDPFGLRSFLYWTDQSRFMFASDVEPILKSGDIPRRLNRRKLAGLSVPTAEAAREEETLFAEIHSLPPGCWMTVAGQGTYKQRYWEPGRHTRSDIPRSLPEACEALRDILFQAVECRLDTDHPVTSLLSGGLDSSGIVAIAALCLKRKNRKLTAISAVLPEETRAQFEDERAFIDQFRSWANIDIHYVTAPGRGPFDTLYDVNRFAVLPLRQSRFYLIEECEKVALAAGSRGLLWGLGGEFGVTSWGGRYYQELAISLRFPTLFREFSKRRTWRNISLPRMLARQLRDTLFPYRRSRPPIFLNKDFQRESDAKPAFRGHWFTQGRYQQEMLRFWISKHALERGQAVPILPPVCPLLDKRVIEFCLGLSSSAYNHNGYPRYLLRGALDGLLPEAIQWRTTKTPFAPDYFVRYNAQIGIAQNFLAAIRPSDPVRSIIDVDLVSSLLKPVDPKVGSDHARDQIPMTLYTINFLRQFPDFRS
jgi:asparagine synthase (glutamine-hydrolysing)